MERDDRRQYERVPFSVDLDILDLSAGAWRRGRCIDLGRGGLDFYAREFMPTGTRIQVTFSIPADAKGQMVRMCATVTHARQEGEGAVMGAAFDAPFSPSSQPLLCSQIDQG
jgi:hypothetical protein